MKKLKAVRIVLWTLGGLAVALAGLYLLRWPLFEGTVRAKLSELIGKELNSEVDVRSLGGSLLRSITAEDIILKPKGNAPIKSATARQVHVVYGFLGSGEPSLAVESARIVLAAKDGPAPPLYETIRDVVSVLRSLRFSGAVLAKNVEVVLPDGRVLALQEGWLDHATWTLTLRTEGFGTVEGAATLRLDGSFTFEGKATEGPLRSARIDLGAGRDRCPLTLSTELLGHALTWTGTATFHQERLSRAEGDLAVKEGRAHTVADFTTGKVDADVDAILAVDEELKGDLTIRARGAGPIDGPAEAWTLQDGTVRTRGARFRTIAVDEAELQLGRGSLAEIPFKATARSGEDRVETEGTFRWKSAQPDFDARARVSVADVAPWLRLIPSPLPVKAVQVRVEGTVSLHAGLVAFDGSGSLGAGSYEGIAWKGATFAGSYDHTRIELREAVVTGTDYAPSISASGKLEGDSVLVRLKADADEIDLGGRFDQNGDFEGRIRVEGPLRWLQAQHVALPESLVPVRMAGKVKREKDDMRVMLDVAAGKKVTLSPNATIRRSGEEWWIALAPTTVTLNQGRAEASETLIKIAPGRVSLDNLKLALTEPDLYARFSGSVAWTDKETKVTFVAADSRVGDTPVETLVARVTVDRASGDILPQLRWGKEDGDHLRVSGRWGRELDLQAELRARDLQRPLLKKLLPGFPVEGAVSLDAHVTGTAEDPRVAGTLNLSKLTLAGLPPLSLVVPLHSEGKRLKIWASEAKTPYGEVEIEGSLPLPGDDRPIDLTLRVASDDFTPLLDKADPTLRAWIPRGGLSAQLFVSGTFPNPVLTGRADFFALRFKPPDPLPPATDLRLSAHLDQAGVAVDVLDGILGQGPFWASGRWDCFQPGRPMSLWLTAQDALVVDDPLARLRVRPDALLTWDEKRGLKLTGRLEVPLLIYHREFGASSIGSHAAATQVTAPKLRLIPAESGGFLIPGIEGLDALQLDLKLTTPGEVRIENNVVGILLGVEGHLGGTASEPALSGTIRSRPKRGEVKLAPGTFMRIESAQIQLPEEAGRAATVAFHGRVGTGEGAIQVIVTGPMDSPSLTLKSDPPLPQKDLLARLAFGVAPGAVSGETGLATVAVYLYEQAQDDWPSADRKEGFLDKIRPTVIPGESSQQRRVPWELPPTGTLRSTSLRTEYVYNYYFSIIAETNREGDVGGDLKLKIRF
ncbi:MAG: translocation/assembly module TamB domain-containing protein [Planctomycetaceae bacterium]|nr:translocation/assembly module TamB domain-containing protein [Planctomycetaceae bacterium]